MGIFRQVRHRVKAIIVFCFMCVFICSCSGTYSPYSLETKLMFGLGIIGAELMA